MNNTRRRGSAPLRAQRRRVEAGPEAAHVHPGAIMRARRVILRTPVLPQAPHIQRAAGGAEQAALSAGYGRKRELPMVRVDE